MFLAALAVAPGLAICFYFFYTGVHDREPAANLFFSFLLGMLVVLPAGVTELLFFHRNNQSVVGTILASYLAIGLVEELAKFLVLRYYCFYRSTFDEPLDGIVYSIMVGMGFATVENAGYIWHYGYEVALLRMFTSVPAHATFAVIMGYYVGKAKFDWTNRNRLLFYGLTGAVVAHGTYDAFLLLSENHWVTRYVSEVLLVGGALASLFICIRLSRKLIQLHHDTSQQLFFSDPMLTVRAASVHDIELIRELCLQVWPQTYTSILTQRQIDYMLELMYSPEALHRQMQENHRFLLVYNCGVPVGFASYNELENGVFKLQKIYVLPVHQGRGTGRFVIDQILKEIVPMGATVLLLSVNRFNKAKDFYEKLGFIAIRAEDTEIGNGFFMNDYIMEKKLVLDAPNVNNHFSAD